MDFYSTDQFSLKLGDAALVISEMDSESVDCIVTSPPYFGLRDYGQNNQYGAEATVDEYISNISKVFIEAQRVLKSTGTLWLNIGDSYDKKKNLLGVPWKTAIQLQNSGYILRNCIIWNKTNPMPQSVTDRFSSKHENIFMFSKERKYKFNLDDVRIPIKKEYNGKTWEERKAAGEPLRRGNSPKEKEITGFAPNPKGKNPGDVWDISTGNFKQSHFATFPEEIPKRCIIAGTNKGDVVLDPFSGSATTGKVSLELDRKYIGIDISEDYHNLALKTRLVNYK